MMNFTRKSWCASTFGNLTTHVFSVNLGIDSKLRNRDFELDLESTPKMLESSKPTVWAFLIVRSLRCHLIALFFSLNYGLFAFRGLALQLLIFFISLRNLQAYCNIIFSSLNYKYWATRCGFCSPPNCPNHAHLLYDNSTVQHKRALLWKPTSATLLNM